MVAAKPWHPGVCGRRFSNKTAAFVELVFEHDGEGFVSDLERLWVKHTFNDAFQLAGGRNKNKIGTIGTTTGHAYYLQASYQFMTDWKAIYRHSALSFDADKDSYFKILDAQEQSHNVVALRYEIDDVNALKAEIDFMKSDTLGLEDSTSYRVQWVYIIP